MLKKMLAVFLILLAVSGVIYSDNKSYSFEIMKDTKHSTSVYVNEGQYSNTCIMIIGGIHGDEPAGIKAAEKLIDYIPQKGTLIIIPRANYAACLNNNRTEYYMDDLNRSFIGKEEGTTTERLAWEIVNIIKDYEPDLILDLHESKGKYSESTEFIGQSIVLSETDNLQVIELAFEISDKMGFTVLSGAPEGSINNEISANFNIPVITVETSTDAELEDRVEHQLSIIHYVLDYYEMDG